ncbi:MAG: hypothetical protein OEW33_14955, partial [Nitrospirota bacterium]|nr:hypothetical protein [Nitrospirota bacterium]
MSPVISFHGVFALALAIVFSASVSEAKGPVRASADIQDCDTVNPFISGSAQLKEEKTEEGIKEVQVMMMVKGLTPGK